MLGRDRFDARSRESHPDNSISIRRVEMIGICGNYAALARRVKMIQNIWDEVEWMTPVYLCNI
jgi:cobyric acid synthase